MKRFMSRKFIMAMAAQAVAVVAMIWPEHQDRVGAVIQSVAALAVAVLTAIGYIRAEASVDRAGLGKRTGEP